MERGLTFAHRSIAEHEVLQRVLQTEPELLLPALTVKSDTTLGLVAAFLTPYLEQPPVGPGGGGAEAADFLARMVLSYMTAPGRWDLDDPEQVARLVRAELLGGILPPEGPTAPELGARVPPALRRALENRRAPMPHPPSAPGPPAARPGGGSGDRSRCPPGDGLAVGRPWSRPVSVPWGWPSPRSARCRAVGAPVDGLVFVAVAMARWPGASGSTPRRGGAPGRSSPRRGPPRARRVGPARPPHARGAGRPPGVPARAPGAGRLGGGGVRRDRPRPAPHPTTRRNADMVLEALVAGLSAYVLLCGLPGRAGRGPPRAPRRSSAACSRCPAALRRLHGGRSS